MCQFIKSQACAVSVALFSCDGSEDLSFSAQPKTSVKPASFSLEELLTHLRNLIMGFRDSITDL